MDIKFKNVDERLYKVYKMHKDNGFFYTPEFDKQMWRRKSKIEKKMIMIELFGTEWSRFGGLTSMISATRQLLYDEMLKYRPRYWFLSDKEFKQYSRTRGLDKYVEHYIDKLNDYNVSKIDTFLLKDRTINIINKNYPGILKPIVNVEKHKLLQLTNKLANTPKKLPVVKNQKRKILRKGITEDVEVKTVQLDTWYYSQDKIELLYLRTFQIELYDKYVFNERAVVWLDKNKQIDYKRLTYQDMEKIDLILQKVVDWNMWKKSRPTRPIYNKYTDKMI
jgi:hypothetical protein